MYVNIDDMKEKWMWLWEEPIKQDALFYIFFTVGAGGMEDSRWWWWSIEIVVKLLLVLERD